MGWSGATEVVGEIIYSARKYVPIENRIKFYKDIINIFENEDWDTQDECLGIDIYFDLAMEELHPDWDFRRMVN